MSCLILYMVKISVLQNVAFDVQQSQDESADACRKDVKDQCTVEHFSPFSHSMCYIRNCKWNVLCVTLVLQPGTHVAISHLYYDCVTICDFSVCQSSPVKASLSDNYVQRRSRSLILMRSRTLKHFLYMSFATVLDEGQLKQLFTKRHSSLLKLKSREPKCSLTLACCDLQRVRVQCKWSISRLYFNAHRFEFLES